MKIITLLILATLSLLIIGCGATDEPDEIISPEPPVLICERPVSEPAPTLEPEIDPEFNVDPIGESEDNQDDSFTIEQIQAVLEESGAFMVGDYGEGNPQVISVERVERDRDYIQHEGAGPDAEPVDLTNSFLYRVEIKFRQPLEDFKMWFELYEQDEIENPFRRDGDYTIMIEYYYFNDVNGEPKLAFLSC